MSAMHRECTSGGTVFVPLEDRGQASPSDKFTFSDSPPPPPEDGAAGFPPASRAGQAIVPSPAVGQLTHGPLPSGTSPFQGLAPLQGIPAVSQMCGANSQWASRWIVILAEWVNSNPLAKWQVQGSNRTQVRPTGASLQWGVSS